MRYDVLLACSARIPSSVSNPAVTCVIPGTDMAAYAEDNNAAARGRLPNALQRKRIEQYFDQLA